MKDILFFKIKFKNSHSTNIDLSLSVKINYFKHNVAYVTNTKHTLSVTAGILTSYI